MTGETNMGRQIDGTEVEVLLGEGKGETGREETEREKEKTSQPLQKGSRKRDQEWAELVS